MRIYTITIPAYSRELEARSKKEALEQFWFDYDCAQDDPVFGEPIISVNYHGQKNSK